MYGIILVVCKGFMCMIAGDLYESDLSAGPFYTNIFVKSQMVAMLMRCQLGNICFCLISSAEESCVRKC